MFNHAARFKDLINGILIQRATHTAACYVMWPLFEVHVNVL
jgi:hypothetical protein